MLKFLWFLYFLYYVNGLKIDGLPTEKCKITDSECLKQSLQKVFPIVLNGIPELGVENMTTLKVEDLSYEVGGFHFSLRNGSAKGLPLSTIDLVEWNPKEKFFIIEYHLDSFLSGNYTAAGNLFTMPVHGEGYLTVETKKLHVRYEIYCDLNKGSDGKDYLKPKYFNLSYDVKESAVIFASNLFDGNKEMTDSILRIVNKNWKIVCNEVGRPIVYGACLTLFKNVKILFKQIAISDMIEM